jgi:hypothetical protein
MRRLVQNLLRERMVMKEMNTKSLDAVPFVYGSAII